MDDQITSPENRKAEKGRKQLWILRALREFAQILKVGAPFSFARCVPSVYNFRCPAGMLLTQNARPMKDHSQPHPTPLIPDHQIIRRIGQGNYGEVWLARNVVGIYRAVKIVFRANFEEARPYASPSPTAAPVTRKETSR